ncbi:hypothetical protein GE300_14575 [Rhodobacteraceae bacterium 2CG4]|uniref:Uncharacterized protein n=2 Tax=Halovulum marinum TaxID=2662447 RepID=A0A6L5Z2N4_9RHOB|nr:hypothetical protein [Halovulum marinum]
MAQALCPSCSGKGSVDNFVCGFCGGTGFVKSPGGGGGGDGPPLPPGLPITGLLRIFALILVACAGYATFLAYQNAPGSGSDKVFTASITFGLLGLGIIIVVRVLQHALVVGIVLAVLVGIDFAMNDGGFTNGAVSLAGPAAEEVMGWLRYLVLGPG